MHAYNVFIVGVLWMHICNCDNVTPQAEIMEEYFDANGPHLMETGGVWNETEWKPMRAIRKEMKRLKKERRQERRDKRINRRLNKKLYSAKKMRTSELDPPFASASRHELQIQKPSQVKIPNTRRRDKKLKNTPTCTGMEGLNFQACYNINGSECTGNGRCVCGSCFCDTPFYGSHCQCDDTACPSKNGVMCGGTKQGQCRCGSCVCRPNFTGDHCECSTEISACKTSMGQICSGKGLCKCNRCYCDEGFVGSVCEESIYSASVCEKLKPCVLCQAYGWYYPQCEDCQIQIIKVNDLEKSRQTCVMVNLGCILKYSYEENPENENLLSVYVPKSLTCPSPRNSEKKKLLHQPPK